MIVDDLFEAPQPCPECGGVSFSNLILAEKKDACYYKVKASAKVWPSAYASGRLVQCRKKGASNYGNKSESMAESELKDKADLDAKRKALQDMEREPGHDAEAIRQRKLDLEKEARAKGVAEATGDSKFDTMMSKISQPAMQKAEQDRKLSTIQSVADALCNDLKCDYDDLTDQDLEFIAGEAGASMYEVMSALGRQKFNAKRNIGKWDDEDINEQGVAEGSFDYAKRGKELDASTKKIQANADRRIRGKELDASVKNIQTDLDKRIKKTDKGVAEEGERGRGRPTTGEWDPTSGKVGRTEKTPTGIRHHADPSRYGGSETEPELDRLDKNKVNAMDKALGVKWDRESKRYYSPIKVDETKPKEKEADYGPDYQDMVARVKKLAGLGPLKTVWDPKKRVYRNVPTAEQPKK